MAKCKFYYKGLSLSEYCKNTDLKYGTTLYRIRKYGWSVDKAAKSPRVVGNKKYFLDGVDLKTLAEDAGQSIGTLYYRIRKQGMSIEQALAKRTKKYLKFYGEQKL